MPKGKGRQDPLGNYIDWSQHTLDPGHYLGGTIEPHLRRSALGPRARRQSGALLIMSGIMSVLVTVAWVAGEGTVVWLIGVVLGGGISVVTIAAGISMWRSGPRRRSSKIRRT